MFIVVVYDISDDKRRTKLHNALKDFGTPVQYSVFECLLAAKRLAEMKKRVYKIIKPRRDHVRFYYLCERCLSKTEVSCGPQVLHETDSIVV